TATSLSLPAYSGRKRPAGISVIRLSPSAACGSARAAAVLASSARQKPTTILLLDNTGSLERLEDFGVIRTCDFHQSNRALVERTENGMIHNHQGPCLFYPEFDDRSSSRGNQSGL